MKRRHFLMTAVAAVAAAHPAFAQDIVSAIRAQLRAQGYTSISVTRTLLGRRRIFAKSDEYQREIIVNPRTGEILRDYWTLLPGVVATPDNDMQIVSGGSDSSDDDDDDDDDKDDDDKDDDKDDDDKDNSGSSSNSGPGGGSND